LRPWHGAGVARSTAMPSRAPRSILDLIRAMLPRRRVTYVPSAALIVHRVAFGAGFDLRLRYGEDADFVWRLRRQDWRVRYDSATTVHHDEPDTLRALLRRRYHYGTSAGALAQRHRGAVAPPCWRVDQLPRWGWACAGARCWPVGSSRTWRGALCAAVGRSACLAVTPGRGRLGRFPGLRSQLADMRPRSLRPP
jgi:Glycosyl transferase family group 2